MNNKKNIVTYKPIASDRLITAEAVLDYNDLAEPNAFEEGGELKYKAHLILGDDDIKKFEAEAERIKVEAFGVISQDKLQGWPVKYGNKEFFEDKEKPEKYEHLTDASWIAPSRYPKLGPPALFEYDFESKSRIRIKEADQIREKFYRGAKVAGSFTMASYKVGPNKGITTYLSSVMFIRDGERLSSEGSEFDGLEFELDSPSDSDAVAEVL